MSLVIFSSALLGRSIIAHCSGQRATTLLTSKYIPILSELHCWIPCRLAGMALEQNIDTYMDL